MPEPTKIPRPFADSGDKNSIPDSSGSIGFASWQEGFPAITSEPFAQGGIAPKRADFNGVFNALSAALVWAQQGGVYSYDATTDYEVGNITEKSGLIYICKTANGPSSAVKDPAADTTETYWGRIYPQNGTFDRMFFSQTSGSYTAPYTGVYRITLKGGGGGGGGANTAAYFGGGGGGEGGTIRFYETLTQGQSYPYVIGAGGAAGTNAGSATAPGGGNGGISSFNSGYSVNGGGGGGNQNSASIGGRGGLYNGAPLGAVVERIPGQSGADGVNGGTKWGQAGAKGGGSNGTTQGGFNAQYGSGGDGGGGFGTNAGYEPKPGADGYILIEYAG